MNVEDRPDSLRPQVLAGLPVDHRRLVGPVLLNRHPRWRLPREHQTRELSAPPRRLGDLVQRQRRAHARQLGHVHTDRRRDQQCDMVFGDHSDHRSHSASSATTILDWPSAAWRSSASTESCSDRWRHNRSSRHVPRRRAAQGGDRQGLAHRDRNLFERSCCITPTVRTTDDCGNDSKGVDVGDSRGKPSGDSFGALAGDELSDGLRHRDRQPRGRRRQRFRADARSSPARATCRRA